MKKMILGLTLCFGLSQVAVAMEDKLELGQLTEKETNKALAWIKNNPKKAKAIAAAVAAASIFGTFAAYEIRKEFNKPLPLTKADSEKSKMSKLGTGFKEAAKDLSIYPAQFAWGKAKDCKKTAIKAVKEHYVKAGISVAVIVVIAAAVIAEFTTDEDSNLKVTNLLKKLVSKKAEPAVE